MVAVADPHLPMQDRAYVLHAANAYPQLVAAIQGNRYKTLWERAR